MTEISENSDLRKVGKRKDNRRNGLMNAAKVLKNSGCAYTSSRGKEVAAREMGPHCGDNCKRKCSQVFNEEERKDTFSSYLGSGDVNVQRIYCWLCTKVNIGACVSNKVRVEKKKSTLTYSLFKEIDRKTALRKHFLNNLGIKQDFVYGVITKANDTGIVSQMREASTKTTKVHLKTTLMRSRITSKVFLWFPSTIAAMMHLNCSWRLA